MCSILRSFGFSIKLAWCYSHYSYDWIDDDYDQCVWTAASRHPYCFVDQPLWKATPQARSQAVQVQGIFSYEIWEQILSLWQVLFKITDEILSWVATQLSIWHWMTVVSYINTGCTSCIMVFQRSLERETFSKFNFFCSYNQCKNCWNILYLVVHTEKSSSLEWNTDVKLFCNETPCSSLLVNRLQIRFVTALRALRRRWHLVHYTIHQQQTCWPKWDRLS